MRTNIVLNDTLVEEAFKYSVDIRTKKNWLKRGLKRICSKQKDKRFAGTEGKNCFFGRL